MPSDDKSSLCLWQGELIILRIQICEKNPHSSLKNKFKQITKSLYDGVISIMKVVHFKSKSAEKSCYSK